MRNITRRLCAIALPFFFAVWLLPTTANGATETVALTFGWPNDLRGNVTFSARTTKTVNGQVDDLSMSGRYSFAAAPADEGLLITFDNVQTEVENAGSGPRAMVKEFMAKATSAPPSYVVSSEGHFVRIEGMATFRDNILSGMDQAFADFPADAREQLARTMSAIFTEEQLQAGIMAEWNMYVGTWLDAEMETGEYYELAYNERMPAFGNMELPMRSTFHLKGRVACNGEEETPLRCVELEIHTTVDPEGLAAAVESFIAQFPSNQTPPRIENLQQETMVRLISEPTTLVPHLMESSRRTVATMSIGDRTQSSSQVEEKRFVYKY